jgi:uncharacterized membrane protein YhhN
MSARTRTRRAAAAMIAACLVGHTVAARRNITWLRAATRCPLMLLLAGYAATHAPTRTGPTAAAARIGPSDAVASRIGGAGVDLGTRPVVWPLVGGLVCAAVGDTVLMRESERALRAGIAAFLGTHACYLIGYLRAGALAGARRRPLIPAGWAGVYLVASAALWRRLDAVRLPVLGYGLALFSMAAAAGATGTGPGAGAALFVLSDLTIGLGVARCRFPGQRAVIAVTYVAGQLLIAHHWLRALDTSTTTDPAAGTDDAGRGGLRGGAPAGTDGGVGEAA